MKLSGKGDVTYSDNLIRNEFHKLMGPKAARGAVMKLIPFVLLLQRNLTLYLYITETCDVETGKVMLMVLSGYNELANVLQMHTHRIFYSVPYFFLL